MMNLVEQPGIATANVLSDKSNQLNSIYSKSFCPSNIDGTDDKMSREGTSRVQKLRREIKELNDKKQQTLLEPTGQLKDIKLRLYELKIFALTRKLQIELFGAHNGTANDRQLLSDSQPSPQSTHLKDNYCQTRSSNLSQHPNVQEDSSHLSLGENAVAKYDVEKTKSLKITFRTNIGQLN